MLFETCWFYRKNYQSNKKCTEHKGCYSVFFLSLTNFELMFRGGYFGVHVETSQFILHIESSGWLFYELQDCGGRWILAERWLKLG